MSLLLAEMVSKQSQNACLSAEASAGYFPVDADIWASLWGIYYTHGDSPCLPHSSLASSISRAHAIIMLPPWKAPQVCDQIIGAIDPALSLSVLPRPGELSARFIFVSRKPCPVNLLRRENMLMISARGLLMCLSRLLAPGWLLGPENQSRGLGHWAQCCLCG